MNFEDYLVSKKIDASAFLKAEPDLFNNWKSEFGQMHPNSFSVQKLNLINPIRRKYQLKETIATKPEEKVGASTPPAAANPAVPKPGKPIIRPKPKLN